MDAKDVARVSEQVVEVSRKLKDASLGVGDLRDGAKSHEKRHLVLKVGGVLRESAEHLSGALRVAYVGDFLALGGVLNQLNDGR